MPTIPYKNKDGGKVCGVTTILNNIGWNKEPLKYWAWKCGCDGINYREATKNACDAGTLGHYLVDCFIKHKKEDADYVKTFPDEIQVLGQKSFQNFLEWANMLKFKPVITEVNLISEVYQYGGTPDCIAEVNKKLALFDWKTSNGVYIEMLLQMYAYKVVWEENYPDKQLTGGIHLVRFTKETASFHHHHWEWNDLFQAGVWDAFQAALTLHNAKKRLEKLL